MVPSSGIDLVSIARLLNGWCAQSSSIDAIPITWLLNTKVMCSMEQCYRFSPDNTVYYKGDVFRAGVVLIKYSRPEYWPEYILEAKMTLTKYQWPDYWPDDMFRTTFVWTQSTDYLFTVWWCSEPQCIDSVSFSCSLAWFCVPSSSGFRLTTAHLTTEMVVCWEPQWYRLRTEYISTGLVVCSEQLCWLLIQL